MKVSQRHLITVPACRFPQHHAMSGRQPKRLGSYSRFRYVVPRFFQKFSPASDSSILEATSIQNYQRSDCLTMRFGVRKRAAVFFFRMSDFVLHYQVLKYLRPAQRLLETVPRQFVYAARQGSLVLHNAGCTCIQTGGCTRKPPQFSAPFHNT